MKDGFFMKKVRIGVFGGFRGASMIKYANVAENATLVAVCDKLPEVLAKQKELCGEDGITYYDNFEDFIKHDMDAVVLANYANEHAPFAIRCMKAGKHVFSEVMPVQTMKEAGEPLNAGKIAELSGIDRKEVDKAMKQLKEEGAIVSPVRCKWAPAE